MKRLIGYSSLIFFIIPLTLSGCNSGESTTTTSSTVTETAVISVVNGTGGGTYNIGDVATITATIPDNKLFDYWAVDEIKVSESNPYSFVVKESATYTAFFKDDIEPLDPDEVLSKILVVSDVHVSPSDVNTANHLKNTLNYAVENNVNAIIFDGDTANVGRADEYSTLDSVFTEVYGTPKSDGLPELIFNMGNHEFYPTDNCAHEETNYDREVSSFKTFAEKWGATIEDNVFVREVGGIECVIAFPSADRNYILDHDIAYAHAGDTIYLAATGAFSQNDVNKMKQKFDSILATGYDKTIVFCTHQPLGKTYGSTIYGMDHDAEVAIKSMLEDYPMIVHFAGHTHFSNLHDRSIFQDDFTSIQIGTHTYGKYVSGVDRDEEGNTLSYENITSKRYNDLDPQAKSYHGQTNFGMLLYFTRANMIANRINLSSKQIYEHGNWTIPYGITKQNKDSKFTYKAEDRTGETLSFSSTSEIDYTIVANRLTSLSFEDVEQYWACEGYEISIRNSSNNTVRRILWSSLFWVGQNQKQTYTITSSCIGDVSIGSDYTLSIRAINFFGYYSNQISVALDGEGTPPGPDDDTLPGHESATLIETTTHTIYGGGLQPLNDWYNSGKSFYFEVKQMINGTLSSGHTFTFSLCGKNYNEGVSNPDDDWHRFTARYVLEFQESNVIVYKQGDGTKTNVATVNNLGDRWFGVKLPYNVFEINTAEKAAGNANETFTLCYLTEINRSFKIDKINSLKV